MNLNIIDIPDVPQRDGNSFDSAVKERLTSAHPTKLSVYTVQELEDLTSSLFEGYLVRCSNGDAGSECLAYCDGFNWKVIEIGSNISLS